MTHHVRWAGVIAYAFSGSRSTLSPFLFLIFMVPLEVGNCGYRCGSMPARCNSCSMPWAMPTTSFLQQETPSNYRSR